MIKLKNKVLSYVTFSKDRISNLKYYITMLCVFGIIANLPPIFCITYHNISHTNYSVLRCIDLTIIRGAKYD